MSAEWQQHFAPACCSFLRALQEIVVLLERYVNGTGVDRSRTLSSTLQLPSGLSSFSAAGTPQFAGGDRGGGGWVVYGWCERDHRGAGRRVRQGACDL